MHQLGLFVFGLAAVFWVSYGLRVAWGAAQLPRLNDFPPLADSECPSVSLIFAARDEEEKLPVALGTLAALNYPNLEIIAVDDRSTDATARLLDEFAAKHGRFRALHLKELPPGWLGKPHALQKAFEVSTGEWLLFTDADVRFAPDCLRRAVCLAAERGLDHCTLLADIETRGFWEHVLVTFFVLAFHLAANPGGMSNPRSRFYAGVGAFQLVRRSAYEASGTHRRLAMEIVDDMKLGKILKDGGFRSGAGVSQRAVMVRWHAGAGNMIRGVTKNFFAGTGYSLAAVAAGVTGLLWVSVLPFVGVVLASGGARWLVAAAVAGAVCFQAGVARVMRASPLYALTHPIGAVLLFYAVMRSTVATLRHGGVTWRDTFYPLKDLRRGSV